MQKYLIAAAGLLSLALVSTARAEDAKLSSNDTKFVNHAAMGGQMEVDLGKVAAEKATSDDVKKFGQQMVDDHTKANDELKQLAQTKGVDLTKSMASAMKKSEKETASLTKKTGADFDKAYVDMMVTDHEKDVKEFEDASKNAKDADLKAWAGKTLPTLQDHLKMIKDIQGKLAK